MLVPNSFLHLPFHFDPDKLKAELRSCLQQSWTPHFNPRDYRGEWNIIALRSLGGREHHITAYPNPFYQNTPLLQKCPAFQEVLEAFECEKHAVRLMALMPGGYIREHCDDGLEYEGGIFRIHVPITTHAQVSFRLNGQLIPMTEGSCWYANFELPHAVQNRGSAPRVHLVMDCLRNAWSDALFKANGYVFGAAPAKTQTIRQEDIPLVIDSLLQMGTEAALKEVARLRRVNSKKI